MRPIALAPAAVVVALLLTAGCRSSADTPAAGDPVENAAADPAVDPVGGDAPATETADDLLEQAATVTAEGFERAIGVWPGFDPREHPTIVPMRVDGRIERVLAVNHPAPDSLGEATALQTDGTPFASLHRVDALDPEVQDRLDRVEHFDFNADLGGVDSFVMVADRSDDFLDPAGRDWAATLIHEMFHRYQFAAFADDSVGQDIDGYAYTADNLTLAALEERALRDAVSSDSADARVEAARRFAGLRLARLAADGRVELDESQERYEGTARYLEHRMSGTDARYSYTDANYDRDLLDGFRTGSVKDDYGFGRFYASGAAVVRLLELFDVADAPVRIERGESPAAVLADHLGVSVADIDGLVAEARGAYGGDQLEQQASAAAAGAADEPSIFGDDTAGDDGHDHADPGTTAADGGEVIDLTDEQLECLDEAELGDGGIVPDEVWEACVGAG